MIAVQFAEKMCGFCRLYHNQVQILAMEQPLGRRRSYQAAWYTDLITAKREGHRSLDAPGFAWVPLNEVIVVPRHDQTRIVSSLFFRLGDVVL